MAEAGQKPSIVAVANVNSAKSIDGGHMLAVEVEQADGSLVALLIPTRIASELIASLSTAAGVAEHSQATHPSGDGRKP